MSETNYPFSVPEPFPPTSEGQETEPPSVRNESAERLPFTGDTDNGTTMPAPTDREIAEEGQPLHRPSWDSGEKSSG